MKRRRIMGMVVAMGSSEMDDDETLVEVVAQEFNGGSEDIV